MCCRRGISRCAPPRASSSASESGPRRQHSAAWARPGGPGAASPRACSGIITPARSWFRKQSEEFIPMRSPFELHGPSQPPASGGKPRHLVVLLHGYGSDGNDLIGLAPHWARVLPAAEFLSPHAPFPCEMGPFGRQWFSFADRTPETILAGTRAAAAILDAFLDEALAARGLSERDLALVGFSQGTMMALYVALRR